MKIVNRKTFLAMPEGTLFSKTTPTIFEGLCIKGESTPDWSGDFWYQSLNDAIKSDSSNEFTRLYFKAQDEGASLEIDFNSESRDGLFEEDQMFAVWEYGDVVKLVAKLEALLR